MAEAYQIKNQKGFYFLTLQVVGWADIFFRKIYRDVIIESFVFYRKSKGLKLYAYVIMSNHKHLTSNEMIESRVNYIHNNPVEAGFVNEPHEWRLSSANPNFEIKLAAL